MTTNLSNMALYLGSWANQLPAVWRKRVYQTVKVVASLLTLALLVLPALPQLGVTLPANVEWGAILTGALAFVSHLADRNTLPAPLADLVPAPEGGNPEPSGPALPSDLTEVGPAVTP